jgi:hypothetical protein
MTALMMEAVRISETSVHFNVTTWRYIPEDSKLQNGVLFNEIVSKHVSRKHPDSKFITCDGYRDAYKFIQA